MRLLIRAAMFACGLGCIFANPATGDACGGATVEKLTQFGTQTGTAVRGVLASGGRVSATGTLDDLVAFAYNLSGEQILTGGSWRIFEAQETFSIALSCGDAGPGADETRRSIQGVLADRFALKAHVESEEQAAYDLVLAGDRPRFRENTGEAPYSRAVRNGMDTHIYGSDKSARELAFILSSFLGKPVTDKTGLGGSYDFDLYFAGNGDSDAPLIDAVKSQLGLSLIPSKKRNQILVIDHIEEPSLEPSLGAQ